MTLSPYVPLEPSYSHLEELLTSFTARIEELYSRGFSHKIGSHQEMPKLVNTLEVMRVIQKSTQWTPAGSLTTQWTTGVPRS